MTELESLARAVASEIVNQTIWENYKFYLLVTAISLVSGAVAAFFVPYLKKRGENLATKADFVEILQQLKATTTLAEGIKSDINAKLEEEHNIRALAREKMEALFEQTFELELWLERTRSNALEGTTPDISASPMAKIEMYQSIYFKELSTEVIGLNATVNAMVVWILGIPGETWRAKAENRSPNVDLEHFAELQRAINDALAI